LSEDLDIHTLFFSPRCQTLLRQVQRDGNVQALLETIRDAFEFAKEADVLRNIKPESRQATILKEMLECVSELGRFIESYAMNVQLGRSSLTSLFDHFNHVIFRKADFEEYSRPRCRTVSHRPRPTARRFPCPCCCHHRGCCAGGW
jgi:hypothetical protein